MAFPCYLLRLCLLALTTFVVSSSSLHHSKLTPYYYHKSCPNFHDIVHKTVTEAIRNENRIGASLLRLHFHDCMVNGCDGSVLLDPSPGIDSEKINVTQNSSLRKEAFDTIDLIKLKIDRSCGSSIVSCSDILALAARDSVTELGGPNWDVPLGGRDATTASSQAARNSLPTATMNLSELIQRFKKQGLEKDDLIALSGAHTLGFGSCADFRGRIYNATNVDPEFARRRRATCPASGGDENLAPFDDTPLKFDNQYFKDLVQRQGLLASDQELYNGGSTDSTVIKYSSNSKAFTSAFVRSMIRLSSLKPLVGNQGEIRLNCRKVN